MKHISGVFGKAVNVWQKAVSGLEELLGPMSESEPETKKRKFGDFPLESADKIDRFVFEFEEEDEEELVTLLQAVAGTSPLEFHEAALNHCLTPKVMANYYPVSTYPQVRGVMPDGRKQLPRAFQEIYFEAAKKACLLDTKPENRAWDFQDRFIKVFQGYHASRLQDEILVREFMRDCVLCLIRLSRGRGTSRRCRCRTTRTRGARRARPRTTRSRRCRSARTSTRMTSRTSWRDRRRTSLSNGEYSSE